MASASPVDTLPIDVWHHIFKFAYTDGGFIGATLSRISRSFRAVSAPYRFHSVRLSNIKGIEKFLAAYEAALADAAASSTDPPRVRHLLFTFLPGEVDMIILEGSFHMRDWHSWQMAKIDWNTRFVARVTRLFELVASHLETFAVLQCPEVVLPFVRCPRFPALRELTLLHEDALFVYTPKKAYSWMEPKDADFFGSGTPPTYEELAASPLFPALERLHLARGYWGPTLPLWDAVAPRLTHLRISGADVLAGLPLWDALSGKPQAFSDLVALVVQPKLKGAETGVDETQAEPLEAIVERLRQVETERPSLDAILVPAVIASPDVDGLRDWTEWLIKEWTARAVGERGPWVTKESEKRL
ncbi:hypothetical protein BD311DRAFT_110290 [Dichomitus squalens]|uniref:Uncharacterized protein n=1 Tax=Dichomitus squalens TaxID=114155 RepID=A0A4Q9MAL3_9APHY|nr:hypothetical protein BD311DRAFT_110290 [Dichomitus squalens]